MDYLDELPIDLQEGFIVLRRRVFSKFNFKWTRTLYYSFRKANIQVPKSFLQADLASITKTNKL